MARRSLGRPKKPKLSTKAGLARKAFEEAKHRRDPAGKFADKPGAGDDAPRRGRRNETKFAEQGVTGAHAIRVIGGGRRYTTGMTVDDYVASVGGDRSTALRRLARDMRAGRIGFEAPAAEKPAAVKAAAIKEQKRVKLEKVRISRKDLEDAGVDRPSDSDAETWNDIVGVRPNEFRAAILRDLPEGSAVTFRMTAVLGPQVNFTVQVKDKGGAEIARADRQISRKSNGSVNVHHDLFVVNSAAQGTGVAKTLLRNSVEVYEDAGVATVDTFANISVGGYAWAKYGFWPRELGVVGVSIRGNLGRLGSDVDDATRAHVEKLLQSKDSRALWAISDLRTPVRLNVYSNADEIAAVLRANRSNDSIGMALLPVPEPIYKMSTVGKELLLGSSWSGELDLRDAESMARFRAYVGGTA